MNGARDTRGLGFGVMGAACLFFVLFGLAPAEYAQVPELEAVAAEAAAAIGRNTQDLKGDARVLVFYFTNEPGSFSRLGSRLADEFDNALKKEARGFVVLARYDNTTYGKYTSEEVGACRAWGDADLEVEGSLGNFPANEIELRLRVLRGDEIVFEKRTKLTLPVSMTREPDEAEIEWPNEMRGEMTWERADQAQARPEKLPGKVEGGHAGYKIPTCALCPNPQPTDDAVKVKAQGTAVLDVMIDGKGQPAAISVVKPLPCGLTERAVDAVKHWKFLPAARPDGTPIAVIAPVEITFRMY